MSLDLKKASLKQKNINFYATIGQTARMDLYGTSSLQLHNKVGFTILPYLPVYNAHPYIMRTLFFKTLSRKKL